MKAFAHKRHSLCCASPAHSGPAAARRHGLKADCTEGLMAAVRKDGVAAAEEHAPRLGIRPRAQLDDVGAIHVAQRLEEARGAWLPPRALQDDGSSCSRVSSRSSFSGVSLADEGGSAPGASRRSSPTSHQQDFTGANAFVSRTYATSEAVRIPLGTPSKFAEFLTVGC